MTIQKGQVLNPKGRGARKPVRDALCALLARPIEDGLNDKPKTFAQQIAFDLVLMATSGNERMQAIKEIIDRTEGKPSQAIIGGDEEDPPIRVEQDVTSIVLSMIPTEKLEEIIAGPNNLN